MSEIFFTQILLWDLFHRGCKFIASWRKQEFCDFFNKNNCEKKNLIGIHIAQNRDKWYV